MRAKKTCPCTKRSIASHARWSLLAAKGAAPAASGALLSRLSDGDVLLIGARPGQGKTMLGLRLLLDAVDDGRGAVFFTLEYSRAEAERRLSALDGAAAQRRGGVAIVTSDDITAESIQRRLAGAAPGTVALIDYLQILDQRRSTPALCDQMAALGVFARRTGIVLAVISQIDRSFDPTVKSTPDVGDVRLPNPIDLRTFSKACFLHDGVVSFQDLV